MNMRSASLHLFSDMLTSIGVLASGIIVKLYQWYYIDAIFSILIASYLLYLSWEIFRDSLRILMQFTPQNINIKGISKSIAAMNGIANMHHVHAWQLDDHKIIFEAHIDLKSDIQISEFEVILKEIKLLLLDHGIDHVNIQPEFSYKDNKELIHEI
jgi:cobalt-zinc-cadmium efflux system protein